MKNPAYGKVRALILQGYIKDFQQIAAEIKKKGLAKDLHMHFDTLQARVLDPGKWDVEQLAALSDFLEIDHGFLLKMADELHVEVKKKKEAIKANKKGKR